MFDAMMKNVLVARGFVAAIGMALTLAAHAATNSAPVISGTPKAVATPDKWYAFQPAASDANGDALRFSITNKPAWAWFNTSTGKLNGKPTASQAGTYANIKISVTDGKVQVALPAFNITVASVATTAPTTGAITLTWEAPTTNADGSALTNLAGYRIYYGTSSTNLDRKVAISGTGLTRYVIDNLPVGTYYVSMTSVNFSGVESALSPVVKKII